MLRISSKIIGVAFVFSGVILFLYFIYSILNGFYEYDLIKTGLVLLINSILVILGLYVKRDIENFRNILLLFITIFFLLTMFELVLSTGYFDNLDSDSPIWIPYRYRLQDDNINNKHRLKAEQNKYGFNDINRKFKRESNNVLRFAVLGDSFVWGTGVADSLIWSHRLQKKFSDKSLNVEILNWGKDGWSTQNEKDFLYETGYKFDIDLIIVTVGANDVDNGKYKLRMMIHPQGEIYNLLQNTLLKIFPNSVSFIIDYINAFSNEYLGYGYSNWLKSNYSKENLLEWELYVKEIMQFGIKKDVKILFVLLPENHSKILDKYFKIMDSILNKINADYVNLFPIIKASLKNYTDRQLWANPANGHPGKLVTKVCSDYIFNYLLKDYQYFFGANKRFK